MKGNTGCNRENRRCSPELDRYL